MNNKIKTIVKIIPLTFFGLALLSIPIHAARAHQEERRDYFINADESYTFKCEAYYDESRDEIRCANRTIEGNFSSYDTTELHSDGESYRVAKSGNKFRKDVVVPTIPKTLYQNDNYAPREFLAKNSKSTETLEVLNTFLDRYMTERIIKVNWIFTEDDLALIDAHHDKWKTQQAEIIAQKKAELKKKQEETEHKKIAEREAEEKRKQEEAKRQEIATTKPKPVAPAQKPKPAPAPAPAPNPTPKPAPTPAPAPAPAPTPVPAPSDNLPLKAICKDGSISYQDTPSLPNYRGMCSGHGGIKEKLGRIP